MKLHISFNIMDLTQAVTVAEEVEEFCDAFEVGPVLLIQHGIKAVEAFRKKFPQKVIICDTNIAEFEKELVALAAQAGSDWVTVLAGAGANTIHNTCTSAHRANKKVMVDFVDAATAGQIAVDAKSLGVDALVVHNTASSSYALMDNWDMVKGNTTLPVFISTHVNRENINELIRLDPTGIFIGSAITQAEKPAEEARYFYEIIKQRP